ncbi:MAG: nitroreductase [Bdellovibrionales bacterium]|nr:nitroreductase [Bdellovibrionales bacterium]
MELIELIKNRRTIHNYMDKPVPIDTLTTAMELAIWAPNHKNTQPWLFYRLGPESRKKIVELALKINTEKLGKELDTAQAAAIAKKFSNCSELIVVGRVSQQDPLMAHEDYASVACAIQNISLYLWQQGIGTKWSTGAITRHPDLYKIIDVAPEKMVLEGFLWVGYAEVVPKTPPKSKIENIFYNTK